MAAVEVLGVSKRFKLYHERVQTLKERVIFFRRNRAYEEFWAVNQVDFEIGAGQTFGLVGANGSGKTTLLRMLAGILRPTSGEIRIEGRVAALLELGAGFHPDLTGRENVYLNGSILGLSRREIDRQFDSIVEFAGLEAFINNQVRHYSSGMYVRLGFAVAVHMDPDILLIDEVLAVGDEAFQDKCLQRIRQFQREGRTIVFVTHSVDQVREMCDRAALLDHGRLAALGSPSDVVRKYRELLVASHPPSEEELKSSGAIEIREVRLVDPEGQPSDVFSSGRPMTVEADLFVHAAIEDAVFNVNIHNNSGQHIFGTNTDWRWMRVDLDPGPARLAVEFPIIPMREGRFTLTLGVHSRDGKTIYAWRDRKTGFEVVSHSDEPGHLYLPCTFAVDGAAVRRAVAR